MKHLFNIAFLSIIFAVFTIAQTPDGFGEGKKRPFERLERYKKIQMVEVLKLDEETGMKLITRYNNHRKSVQQLEKERGELLDKLELQVQSSVSDGEFHKSFNDLLDIERKIIDTRRKYLESLKEIFSTKQIAEYLIFERNFMKDLRNVVNDVQKQRMRRD